MKNMCKIVCEMQCLKNGLQFNALKNYFEYKVTLFTNIIIYHHFLQET